MIFEFILSIHNHLTSWRVFMGTSHIPGCESLKKKLINLYIFFKYKIKEIWQVYTIKNCRPQTRSSKTCLAYFSIFEFLPRAGLNTAWVRHPVFQRVGPGRRSCRHRRVVVESVPREILAFNHAKKNYPFGGKKLVWNSSFLQCELYVSTNIKKFFG